ncbi:MAG: hypothetical protein BECKG1743D_GA0114223_101338 [Candidatus Kentron sp. G]|nr:MAG: hypothetical protein BECKG1743F_GA0114225_101092 [Candidatus Kentron sp. G]VFM97168.1 MAG: hypothetical protein BECKG1743E_GA0114224_101168 [Candidatus Kentron sp. G]VFM99599.1 MAG: hypothetical protein BECKG1743D_GA0114223_101338 [Candidatus Kentron sp. G]
MSSSSSSHFPFFGCIGQPRQVLRRTCYVPRISKDVTRGLPKRWRFVHGCYYYSVPPGQESKWDGKKTFNLGKTLPDAYRVWAARIERGEKTLTIAALFERYALEVIPTKAPKSQTENVRQLKILTEAFGSASLSDVRPVHIYQYVDARSAKGQPPAGRSCS